MYDFSTSPLIANQTPYRGKLTLLSRGMILILLFLVSNVFSALPSYIALIATGGTEFVALFRDYLVGSMTQQQMTDAAYEVIAKHSNTPLVIAMELIGTAALIGAILIFTLCIEKRTMAALGLRVPPKSLFLHYICGAFAGVLLFAAVLGLNLLTRSASLHYEGSSIWWILLFLLGFLIQGFSEELLIHGYVMTTFLAPGRNIWVPVGISSFLFAFLHMGNNGISFFAVLNLCLFGALMGLLTLRTGNIWSACALHSLWNFTQGNLFGVSVSGTNAIPSVFRAFLNEANAMTNGGSFGFEGGLATTLVLLLALVAISFIPKTGKKETKKDDTFSD